MSVFCAEVVVIMVVGCRLLVGCHFALCLLCVYLRLPLCCIFVCLLLLVFALVFACFYLCIFACVCPCFRLSCLAFACLVACVWLCFGLCLLALLACLAACLLASTCAARARDCTWHDWTCEPPVNTTTLLSCQSCACQIKCTIVKFDVNCIYIKWLQFDQALISSLNFVAAR